MSEFRKKFGLFSVISSGILSIFLFILAIKGLKLLDGYKVSESSARGIIVAQLIFALILFAVCIIGVVKVLGLFSDSEIAGRFANGALAIIAVMDLIQIFALLGNLKKSGLEVNVPTVIVISIILYIVAAISFIVGAIAGEPTCGICSVIGCLLSFITIAINIDVSNITFRIQDFFQLLSYSTALFYAASMRE